MQGVLDVPDELMPVAEFLAGSLAKVSVAFDEQLSCDLPPVERLVQHVERYRGKMLRPTLVILSGVAAHARCTENPATLIGDEHVAAGAVCEMVHMATLVHDDVLDEADTRRRGETVNRLHGNETAVMLGDYLIASAYHLCSLRSPRSAVAVARASVVMCSGELLQLHHRDEYSLDEQTYFEIIRRKTGELIATAAELGAACSGADGAARQALRDYAMSLGMAFQIQDDLLDLTGTERTVGKSVGKDLEKGKMTLPVIHHLNKAEGRVRAQTLQLLEYASAGNADAAADIRGQLELTDSVGYAQREAHTLVNRAKRAIGVLPVSPARSMLTLMADAVVSRAF